MKQKIRLGDNYALLYRLSAYWRNQLSEIFRKHKRKPSSRRRFHTPLKNGRPSLASLKEKSCVQTPAKVPALPGLGLAMGIVVFTLSTLNIKLQAQDTIKPLQIGDTIPEYVWHMPLQVVNHPDGRETITLNDYRGKLIILDFWATWCGSCIKAFPILDALQEANPALEVLKITNDELSPSKIKWTSVVADTMLSQIFPHRLIPHYVWIGPAGKVYAFSSTDQLTHNNILEALQSEPASFAIKRDLDKDKPLFLAEDFQSDGLQYYAVLHRGRYYGVGSENLFRMKGDTLTGRALTNRSLFELFSNVAKHLLEQTGELYTANRIIAEVKDSTRLIIDYAKHIDYKNLYSYDINVAPENTDEIYNFMLADFNRSTKYNGFFENRYIQCYVLKRDDTEDKLASKGGRSSSKLKFGKPLMLNNRPLTHLVLFLNHIDKLPMMVLDETAYKGQIDIQLPPFDSVDELNEHLKDYGLALEHVNRLVPMFIIRDK